MNSSEISRDDETGWLIHDGERVVAFRAKTFRALLDKLRAVVGPVVASVLVSKLGEEVGQISYMTWNSLINSEADLAKAIDERFRYRGWGRCLGIEKHRGRKTVYSIRIGHSPLTQDRQASEPTCHFIRGILAAWLEKYVGSKPENAVETKCASVRPSECIFEFTFSATPKT